MASNFKVYPSGFMGAGDAPQTKPLSDTDYFRRIMSSTNVSNADKLTANQEVNRIWFKYNGTLKFNDRPTFEDIITVASHAFGTFDLAEWAKIQVSSPYFTHQHALVIEETLNYLINGKPRIYSIGTRQELMSIHTDSPTQKRLTDRSIKILNGYMGESIVSLWLYREGGYADLLTQLFFMFGLS